MVSAYQDLFQIVKQDKVKKLFDSPPPLDNSLEIDRFLWNLYSASVLLSNDWLNDTGSSKIAKIKVPVS